MSEDALGRNTPSKAWKAPEPGKRLIGGQEDRTATDVMIQVIRILTALSEDDRRRVWASIGAFFKYEFVEGLTDRGNSNV